MDLSLESLVVGLFAILPGFVSGGVRSIFVSSESTSPATWTLTSIIRSLFLNAVAISISIPFLGSIRLGSDLVTLTGQVQSLPGWSLVSYVGLLFFLAVAWGLLTGLLPKLAPQEIAYARRLTPISPEPDVLHMVLTEHFRTKQNTRKAGEVDQLVPWLKFRSGERELFGRLRGTSVRIELDKPFETFLGSVYEVAPDGSVARLGAESATEGAEMIGVYTKIRKEHLVEVFSARADWEPGT